MTQVPIDFVWSSLPVPALLIDPKDTIIETNPDIVFYKLSNLIESREAA